MKLYKKALIVFTVLIIVFGMREYYTTTNGYMIKQHWKVGDDTPILNDGFMFDKALTLKGNTIFKNKEAYALITKRGYRPLISNYKEGYSTSIGFEVFKNSHSPQELSKPITNSEYTKYLK